MPDTIENRDAGQDQRRKRSGCHGDCCRATGEEKIKPAQGEPLNLFGFRMELQYMQRLFWICNSIAVSTCFGYCCASRSLVCAKFRRGAYLLHWSVLLYTARILCGSCSLIRVFGRPGDAVGNLETLWRQWGLFSHRTYGGQRVYHAYKKLRIHC